MNFKKKYLLVCIVLFISCVRTQNRRDSSIIYSELKNVNVDPTMKGLTYGQIVEKIDFIKLEKNKNSNIGEISQLLTLDSSIIVVDKSISKSIFIFNLNGKLRNKISRLGKGPGEYSEILHVSIVPLKKQLAVLDLTGRKMLYYTIEGDFINSTILPFLFSRFEYSDSSKIIFQTSGKYNPELSRDKKYTLLTGNADGEIFFRAFKYPFKDDFHYTTVAPLRKYGSEIFYYPSFTDTIYNVNDGNKLIAKYKFNYRKYGFPTISEDITDDKFSNLSKSHIYFNGNFFELDNTALFYIMTPQGDESVLFTKKTGKTYPIIRGSVSHPFHLFFNIPLTVTQKNRVIVPANAFKILIEKNRMYKLGHKEEVSKLLNNLKEDDNPVLFFHTLKGVNN